VCCGEEGGAASAGEPPWPKHAQGPGPAAPAAQSPAAPGAPAVGLVRGQEEAAVGRGVGDHAARPGRLHPPHVGVDARPRGLAQQRAQQRAGLEHVHVAVLAGCAGLGGDGGVEGGGVVWEGGRRGGWCGASPLLGRGRLCRAPTPARPPPPPAPPHLLEHAADHVQRAQRADEHVLRLHEQLPVDVHQLLRELPRPALGARDGVQQHSHEALHVGRARALGADAADAAAAAGAHIATGGGRRRRGGGAAARARVAAAAAALISRALLLCRGRRRVERRVRREPRAAAEAAAAAGGIGAAAAAAAAAARAAPTAAHRRRCASGGAAGAAARPAAAARQAAQRLRQRAPRPQGLHGAVNERGGAASVAGGTARGGPDHAGERIRPMGGDGVALRPAMRARLAAGRGAPGEVFGRAPPASPRRVAPHCTPEPLDRGAEGATIAQARCGRASAAPRGGGGGGRAEQSAASVTAAARARGRPSQIPLPPTAPAHSRDC
jgi:hypothetical protein